MSAATVGVCKDSGEDKGKLSCSGCEGEVDLGVRERSLLLWGSDGGTSVDGVIAGEIGTYNNSTGAEEPEAGQSSRG
ncbi:hypothetical protein DY000_02037355 [Brassica cretica]|uniref:Uncharacterized protein n=1 Tax=Brassica cretica TaxID=69181 RepID=A0ABQ7BHI9_BRACR|nr:hypothetical protein DY000_02037355 [Brassica cretica]